MILRVLISQLINISLIAQRVISKFDCSPIQPIGLLVGKSNLSVCKACKVCAKKNCTWNIINIEKFWPMLCGIGVLCRALMTGFKEMYCSAILALFESGVSLFSNRLDVAINAALRKTSEFYQKIAQHCYPRKTSQHWIGTVKLAVDICHSLLVDLGDIPECAPLLLDSCLKCQIHLHVHAVQIFLSTISQESKWKREIVTTLKVLPSLESKE